MEMTQTTQNIYGMVYNVKKFKELSSNYLLSGDLGGRIMLKFNQILYKKFRVWIEDGHGQVHQYATLLEHFGKDLYSSLASKNSIFVLMV